jgi:hypothetical protein
VRGGKSRSALALRLIRSFGLRFLENLLKAQPCAGLFLWDPKQASDLEVAGGQGRA